MKDLDSYIFTPDYNHNQMLRRESITKSVNKVMRKVSKQLPNEPNMTSHSFRSGYIPQLWKDTSDIEFVRQAITAICDLRKVIGQNKWVVGGFRIGGS
jgi:hypothetical protein